MASKKFIAATIVVTALVAIAVSMFAQAEPRNSAAYRPGLGDLMTMTIQPRHIKIAFAGREKNWTYAAYEVHELQEAFERIARVWPTWQSFPISELIDSAAMPRIAVLQSAIKSHDAKRFAAAYGQLTEVCNICHQATKRGFVVIRAPETSSFPDQDFRPAKP